MDFTFIDILLLAVIAYLLFIVIKLEGRIKGLQYRVDQVASKVGIHEHPINHDLRKLIKEGKDTEAVKEARNVLGLSLVEGKKYVDDLKQDDR